MKIEYSQILSFYCSSFSSFPFITFIFASSSILSFSLRTSLTNNFTSLSFRSLNFRPWIIRMRFSLMPKLMDFLSLTFLLLMMISSWLLLLVDFWFPYFFIHVLICCFFIIRFLFCGILFNFCRFYYSFYSIFLDYLFFCPNCWLLHEGDFLLDFLCAWNYCKMLRNFERI